MDIKTLLIVHPDVEMIDELKMATKRNVLTHVVGDLRKVIAPHNKLERVAFIHHRSQKFPFHVGDTERRKDGSYMSEKVKQYLLHLTNEKCVIDFMSCF